MLFQWQVEIGSASLSTERWFRISPDHTLRDFHFRPKNSEEPAKNSSRRSFLGLPASGRRSVASPIYSPYSFYNVFVHIHAYSSAKPVPFRNCHVVNFFYDGCSVCGLRGTTFPDVKRISYTAAASARCNSCLSS